MNNPHSHWWKAEKYTPKIWNKTKLPTFAAGISSQSNQTRKRRKKAFKLERET